MNRRILLFIVLNSLLVSYLTGQSIGEYISHQQYDKLFRINTQNYMVDVYFYTANIVQVKFYDETNYIFQPSYTVVGDGNIPVTISVTSDSEKLELVTDSIKIIIEKVPLRFNYFSSGGQLLLTESLDGGLGVQNNKKYVKFDMLTNTGFYGSGERGMDLNLAGHGFNLYNTQAFGYFSAPESMGANVPFVASTGGFGLFFDNEYPAYLSLGKNDNYISYETEYGRINYFFISGSSIPEQVKKYTWLTGRQPLPPKWAFGYIQSKYGYRNANEARQAVNTFRAKNIPLDVLILDLYWFRQMGDISWNTSVFPDPQGMMAEFKEKGVKTVVISEPYITELSTNYNTAASNGYLAKNESGNPFTLGGWWSCGCNAGLLDITNPDAADWWWGKHPGFMGDNLAGFWTDLGEPESHPWEMVHYLGAANKVHNLYNLFWAKLIFENYNSVRPNERLFNLTRSGFAGVQRYGALTWSGDVGADWQPFEIQVPIMLNASISGLAYEHSDLGGFCCGNNNSEIFTRWMQSGAFAPVMRAHGQDVNPQEPWGYGTTVENNIKKFINLRYSLLPYNYSLARENSITGMPLARPFIFTDETDISLLNEKSGYLWGDNIAVYPLFNSGTLKQVKLPVGEWVDFWTDQVRSGGNYNLNVPLNSLPVFIKKGSIIPRMPVMDYVGEFPADTLYVSVYPAENRVSEFVLYEDDGVSLDYQSGEYSNTNISASEYFAGISEMTMQISNDAQLYEGKPANRTYVADFHLIKEEPGEVAVNGFQMLKYPSLQLLRESSQGYFYDDSRDILYAQIYGHIDSSYTISAGNFGVVGVNENENFTKFELAQNYPNPFNPSTTIRYSISKQSTVRLSVFDVLGEEVSVLVNQEQTPGNYEVSIDATNLASGIYIYRLTMGDKAIFKKMTLLK